MNIITVIFKQSPHCLTFYYDKYADADKRMRAYDAVVAQELLFLIDDDYGSKATLDTKDIAGILLTDVPMQMSANEEIELEKHRKDIRVGKVMRREQQNNVITPQRMQS